MPEPLPPQAGPRIGVALGSGAARGLAHIPYIEAFDELGLRPAVIAGSSIGALIGAGWANGMTGGELREHAMRVLGGLDTIAGRIWNAGLPTLKLRGLSLQADPRTITDAFLPDAFPTDFSALAVPFNVVATDIRSWTQVVFGSGELRPAIAASIAIPSLFRPVDFDGKLFIDGGVTNPLPLDRAALGADILVGIDVNGVPDERFATSEPSIFDTGFIATQIMSQTLIRTMMALYPPDVYVQPDISSFAVMEFWRVGEILAQVETDKDRFKKLLTEKIEAFEVKRRGRV